MQVSTLFLLVAIEIYVALLIATVLLILYALKQKSLIRRQQEKMRELIESIKNETRSDPAAAKTYKELIYDQLEQTQDRFKLVAPGHDISEDQPDSSLPTNQRVIALRYAFLRAEELGTTEVFGSEGYWNIFHQTLEPLLLQTNHDEADTASTPADADELEMYKKRVDNLEKFKKLFFDLEKRWNEAQANAQTHYSELQAMADGIEDRERYEMLLKQYENNYSEMGHYVNSTSAAITGQPLDSKTINIVRQDPRAAEEIMKLRNVAADQYRVISNLQRKLEGATTAEEKDIVIKELEQQLQRQVRFVQESDTCVQLLEEELNKANEQIVKQEKQIEDDHLIEDENQRIKDKLQSFTHESKELLENLEDLERENDSLKNATKENGSPDVEPTADLAKIQSEFIELRKQYSELEEKYLELKLK